MARLCSGEAGRRRREPEREKDARPPVADGGVGLPAAAEEEEVLL